VPPAPHPAGRDRLLGLRSGGVRRISGDVTLSLARFGLAVGHATDAAGATGCTVVRGLDAPLRGACAVIGRATGSRELALLEPGHLVERVDAVLLAGGSAYGLDAASRTYFGKQPADLTLAESAMLASFPKAPTRFANEAQSTRAKERQHYVLTQMVEAGFISKTQADEAYGQELLFAKDTPDAFTGHALDYAVERVHDLLPNPPPDLVIKLTLDLTLQAAAQEAVEQGLATMGKDRRASEGAALLIDVNGAVRAMVGGRDYLKSQFNRATQARRQPGSSFKMFVYAAALEDGMTPGTVRYDMPITINNWRPRNYGGEYHGAVTLSEALAESLNTVAAQIGNEIGVDKVTALN